MGKLFNNSYCYFDTILLLLLFNCMMEIDDNLIGLENLILNKELSAEEYFTIVVSTCQKDLKIAKSAVANVLKKINPNEVTYQELKTLYNEFFQEEFCINKNSSESNTDDA